MEPSSSATKPQILPKIAIDSIKLEEHLLTHIFGQDPAIFQFIDQIELDILNNKTSQVKQKIHSLFIVSGHAKVGKKHLFRLAAKWMDKPLKIIDMSDYRSVFELQYCESTNEVYDMDGFIQNLIDFVVKDEKNRQAFIIFDHFEKCAPILLKLLINLIKKGFWQCSRLKQNISFQQTTFILITDLGSNNEVLNEKFDSMKLRSVFFKSIIEEYRQTCMLYQDIRLPTRSDLIMEDFCQAVWHSCPIFMGPLSTWDQLQIIENEVRKITDHIKDVHGFQEILFPSEKIYEILLRMQDDKKDLTQMLLNTLFFFESTILNAFKTYKKENIKSTFDKVQSINFIIEFKQIDEIWFDRPNEPPRVLIFCDKPLWEKFRNKFPNRDFLKNFQLIDDINQNQGVLGEIDFICIDPLHLMVVQEQFNIEDTSTNTEILQMASRRVETLNENIDLIRRKFDLGTYPLFLLSRTRDETKIHQKINLEIKPSDLKRARIGHKFGGILDLNLPTEELIKLLNGHATRSRIDKRMKDNPPVGVLEFDHVYKFRELNNKLVLDIVLRNFRYV